MLIGIDVGGTKIAAGLVGQQFRLLARIEMPTPCKGDSRGLTEAICRVIERLLDAENTNRRDIRGIGIGIGGIVDKGKGCVLSWPNMQLSNLYLATTLEHKYQVPVFLENDVNAGLLGEKYLGAAQGASNVIGLFLGTGLGGAIIVQDRIITGAHQAAGEIGHMVVDDEGPLCTCGNYGCVEAFVGRWAIDRDIRAALRQGQQSILSEKIPIDRNILVESSSIREALEKGDALARAIIGGVACKLSLVCISLRHLLDPELIVFGGGLIGVCGQYIMPLVKEAVAHDPYHNSLPVCRVVVGELGADAVILGAAVSAARALGTEILTSRPCPE